MKNRLTLCFVVLAVLCTVTIVRLPATTLMVGQGQTYATPQQAAVVARAGDTVLITEGTYRGTFWIENLHGTERLPIVIRGVDSSAVKFVGGTESMHFSDCSYLLVENMTITGQTGNGMNVDDGGSIDTPTHHIIIRSVLFDSMDASGNNDMLKLSGLDDFEISNCTFSRGAAGGSGIDMVGCHRGRITNNVFTTLGSNAIQAKGGTQFINILRNSFTNAGQRSVNLGGSTGLAFFRPLDAPFEAADIFVGANIFRGSVAPIAYVGCTRVAVVNNTIIDPERWVMRILQETVDPQRFVPCGNSLFANNLIVYTNSIATHINIGTNTDPGSFVLQNNLWYNRSNPSQSAWSNPQITQQSSIYGLDPELSASLQPSATSPCKSAGAILTQLQNLTTDFYSQPFGVPPSIGAVETAMPTSIRHTERSAEAYPNTAECLTLAPGRYRGVAVDVLGRILDHIDVTVENNSVRAEHFRHEHSGTWWLVVTTPQCMVTVPMIGEFRAGIGSSTLNR